VKGKKEISGPKVLNLSAFFSPSKSKREGIAQREKGGREGGRKSGRKMKEGKKGRKNGVFFPGWSQIVILPSSTSCVAGIAHIFKAVFLPLFFLFLKLQYLNSRE
jgi:hypothetical protein